VLVEQPGEGLWGTQQYLLRLAPLLLTRELARTAANVRRIADWLRAAAVRIADAVALAPGPAGPKVRQELAADPTAPVVLSLSRLVPHKGVDHLIRAVAALSPVVAYPAPGTPEIVRDGETGLLARQEDVAHLAACIGRVLTDAGLRAHLARAARAHVVTTFTLEQQADRQARFLDELLSGHGFRRLRARSAVLQECTA
jgi:glycosyltransferase involved in cell wall biosynthesis